MGVEVRGTKWGRILSVSADAGAHEVMHFDGPGKYHVHEGLVEVVHCVAGEGWVDQDVGINSMAMLRPGHSVHIPAGVPHRMRPTSPQGFTCLVTYRKD